MRTVGIIVFGGLLAGGCLADMPGAPEKGANVGSTEQAITANLPATRSYGDGIRLSMNDSNNTLQELELYAGGYSQLTPSTTVANNIYLGVGASFVTPDASSVTTVPASVAHLKIVNDPNSTNDSGIAFGGEGATATSLGNAVRLIVSPSGMTWHIASTTITGLTARSHFEALPCGTGSLIALNGVDSSGNTLANVQVLKAGATAWTSVTVTGTLRDRQDFGLALVGDGTNKTFFALGGFSSSLGARRRDGDVLQFTTASCDAVTVTQLANVLPANGVSEMVAFETSWNNTSKLSTIIVPGGTNGTTRSSMDTIVLDFHLATPSLSSTANTASALQGATRRMKLVILPNGDAYISGGVDNAGAALTFVSKFPAGGSAFANQTAITAREGHAFFYLPTANKIQVMAGNSGTTLLDSDVELTP